MTAAPPPAVRARARLLPALLTVVTLVIAAVGWKVYTDWRDRPPFSASEVEPRAVVRFTAWGPQWGRDTQAIGAEELGARPAGALENRLFVGRLDHRARPAPVDKRLFYHVLVIDKRHERVASVGNAPRMRPSFLTGLPERYSWLSALGGADRAQGWTVTAPVAQEKPILFAGNLPDAADLTADDLMVVLVLVGRDGIVHWAERVAG